MTKKTPPREVPPREDFYMGMAHWYASKSKDPSTQIGAVIVSYDNRPLGFGYNGPPRQINDLSISWDRPDKYDYMYHAEENAIDYSTGSLEGSTIYVSGKPCKRCMLKIVKFGIKKVVFFPLKKTLDKASMFNDVDMLKTEEIAKLANIQLVEYKGNLGWMQDRIKFMEMNGIFD